MAKSGRGCLSCRFLSLRRIYGCEGGWRIGSPGLVVVRRCDVTVRRRSGCGCGAWGVLQPCLDRGASSGLVRVRECVQYSLCTLSPQNLAPSLHPIQATFQNDAKNLTTDPPSHSLATRITALPQAQRATSLSPTATVSPPHPLRASRPNRQRVAFQRPDHPCLLRATLLWHSGACETPMGRARAWR